MYHILQETKGPIIAIRIEGYMTSQDYKTLMPYVKNRISQYGRIRFLIELKDFKGFKIVSLLKVGFYAIKYGRRVAKKAVMTDEPWVYSWASFLSPFFKTKVRCFPTTEGEKAREWVRR
jgi:hypothetical protein